MELKLSHSGNSFQNLESVLKSSKLFLFCSYITGNSYNDIDCLIVIDDIKKITKELIDQLEAVDFFHFTIYTEDEFRDRRNKFSINGKKKIIQINYSNFISLLDREKVNII